MDMKHIVWGIPGVLFIVAYLALVIGFIIWAYGDAERRGKSGCLVLLLVLLSFPLGLIIWLIFRPEKKPPTLS